MLEESSLGLQPSRGTRVCQIVAGQTQQLLGFAERLDRGARHWRWAAYPILAIHEAEEGLDRVMSFGEPVELAPREANVRRLQHLLIEEHGFGSQSRGTVPWRRVVILPTRG